MPEAAHTRSSRPLRALLVAVAIVAAQATPVHAAERHADRSIAEAARVSLAEAADRMVEGTRDIGLFALVAHRHRLSVRRRNAGSRTRLQRPHPLRVPAGHRRHAAAHGEGAEPHRQGHPHRRPASPATSCSSTPGDSRSRTSASTSATTASSTRRRAAAKWSVASLASAYWQKHFNGARRLVGVLPALMPSLIAHAEASSPADAAEPPDADANASAGPIEDQQP